MQLQIFWYLHNIHVITRLHGHPSCQSNWSHVVSAKLSSFNPYLQICKFWILQDNEQMRFCTQPLGYTRAIYRYPKNSTISVPKSFVLRKPNFLAYTCYYYNCLIFFLTKNLVEFRYFQYMTHFFWCTVSAKCMLSTLLVK